MLDKYKFIITESDIYSETLTPATIEHIKQTQNIIDFRPPTIGELYITNTGQIKFCNAKDGKLKLGSPRFILKP